MHDYVQQSTKKIRSFSSIYAASQSQTSCASCCRSADSRSRIVSRPIYRSSNSKMIIRPANSNDRSNVIALWDTVFPDDPPHNAPAKVFDAKLALKDDMLLVAVQEDAVIGTTMAGYDGHRGWLHKVAVLPQYQRRGIARSLVRHAISALQSIGCTKVNLQIRLTNTDVRKFYEALGFDVEERLDMAKHIG